MQKSTSKPKSKVNNSFATPDDQKDRFKKLGKNYRYIDFEMSDKINGKNYEDRSIPIGTLEVGRTKVELTWAECSKIISTLEDAQVIHKQKIRLGIE